MQNKNKQTNKIVNTFAILNFDVKPDSENLQHFWFKDDLDRNMTHPKFDLTEVWTHDLQIMKSIFHAPEMLSWPLGHQGPKKH